MRARIRKLEITFKTCHNKVYHCPLEPTLLYHDITLKKKTKTKKRKYKPEIKRDRQTDRQTETETERQKQRQRQRDRTRKLYFIRIVV